MIVVFGFGLNKIISTATFMFAGDAVFQNWDSFVTTKLWRHQMRLRRASRCQTQLRSSQVKLYSRQQLGVTEIITKTQFAYIIRFDIFRTPWNLYLHNSACPEGGQRCHVSN